MHYKAVGAVSSVIGKCNCCLYVLCVERLVFLSAIVSWFLCLEEVICSVASELLYTSVSGGKIAHC